MISEYLIKKAAENTTVPQQQNNDNEMDPTGETYPGGWQLPYDPHRPANPSRPKFTSNNPGYWSDPQKRPERLDQKDDKWERMIDVMKDPRWRLPQGDYPYEPWITGPYGQPSNKPGRPYGQPWGQPHGQPWGPFGPSRKPSLPIWEDPINPGFNPFGPRRKPSTQPWINPGYPVNPGYPINPGFDPFGPSRKPSLPSWVTERPANPGYPVNPRFNPWKSSNPDNEPWWKPMIRTATTPEPPRGWHGVDPYTFM